MPRDGQRDLEPRRWANPGAVSVVRRLGRAAAGPRRAGSSPRGRA